MRHPSGLFRFRLFDYGLGWTTDLPHTFRRLASYLKPGGTLIFSWNHPLYGRAGCVQVEDGKLVVQKSYFDQSDTRLQLDDGEMLLRNYRLSDYLNALADAGIAAEELEQLRKVWQTYAIDILGLQLEGASAGGDEAQTQALYGAVDMLLNMRLEAKRNKDWGTSDKIRNELTALGFSIKDTKDGFEWTL